MSRAIPIVILATAALLCGCAGDAGPEPAEAAPAAEGEARVPIDRYTLRGEVTAMPDERDPRRIYVLHEAIPTFRFDGEVVGMDSMTMPFTLADGVEPDGLDVGTKIEFDWEIGPEAPAGVVVRFDVLPDDTALELARPQAPSS